MQHKVQFSSPDFIWIDVAEPTREELTTIAETYKLHPTSVQDCLDPEHLPKYEKIGETHFLILRTFDDTCSPDGDEVQELTRKIAVFYTDKFLLTVHRVDQPFLANMRNKWSAENKSFQPSTNYSEVLPLPFILYDILLGTLLSFDRPVDAGLNVLERLEMDVFGARGSQPFQIESGYYLKRRASVFKRTIRLTIDILPKVAATMGNVPMKYQDLKDQADSLMFYTDDLLENVNTLMNLHISLSSQKVNEASHRTGEVVRVLTIFSVFLLPLNLITGIYGMNFEFIPELKWQFGYPMALAVMIIVVTAIYFWFQRQGWLKRRPDDRN